MRVRAIGTVKYKGVYLPPGTEMDVETEIAEYLVSVGAAESLEAVAPSVPEVPKAPEIPDGDGDGGSDTGPSADDIEAAIEELCQVDGVNKVKAVLLINHGILSIEQLQQCSEEQLASMKGISKKGAKVIMGDVVQFTDGPEE